VDNRANLVDKSGRLVEDGIGRSGNQRQRAASNDSTSPVRSRPRSLATLTRGLGSGRSITESALFRGYGVDVDDLETELLGWRDDGAD